jgi:hypothetical protein
MGGGQGEAEEMKLIVVMLTMLRLMMMVVLIQLLKQIRRNKRTAVNKLTLFCSSMTVRQLASASTKSTSRGSSKGCWSASVFSGPTDFSSLVHTARNIPKKGSKRNTTS